MCSILAGTKLCYGNKWLGRDVSMGGPPFLICLSLEQLPSQMGRASITLLSGTWRSPKQSRAPVVMWDCFPKFKSPKWQPTPVFLLGEPYGQRSLAGYSPQNLRVSWLKQLNINIEESKPSRHRLSAGTLWKLEFWETVFRLVSKGIGSYTCGKLRVLGENDLKTETKTGKWR